MHGLGDGINPFLSCVRLGKARWAGKNVARRGEITQLPCLKNEQTSLEGLLLGFDWNGSGR